MTLLFEKVYFDDTDDIISELSEFAGKIFFDYYDSYLPAGQALYMKEKFLSPEALREKLSPEHSPQAILELVKDADTNEKLGFICYWKQKDETEKDECYLDKYYLAEKFRGKGLGRLIIDHLKIFCSENSLKQISLNVNKYNKTIAIYEKLGFINHRSEVNDIGNGYVMDDYVMRLYLQGNEE